LSAAAAAAEATGAAILSGAPTATEAADGTVRVSRTAAAAATEAAGAAVV
jgi:hypothetical protein